MMSQAERDAILSDSNINWETVSLIDLAKALTGKRVVEEARRKALHFIPPTIEGKKACAPYLYLLGLPFSTLPSTVLDHAITFRISPILWRFHGAERASELEQQQTIMTRENSSKLEQIKKLGDETYRSVFVQMQNIPGFTYNAELHNLFRVMYSVHFPVFNHIANTSLFLSSIRLLPSPEQEEMNRRINAERVSAFIRYAKFMRIED